MEQQWDKLLKIKTGGRDDSKADQYHYPYEPTPYSVLERLANSGYIEKRNRVLDYGCGKGRVDFFLAYQNRCKTIGIDFDERLFRCAEENRGSGVSGKRCEFTQGLAQEFELETTIDRCYFFNPFSLEVFQKVLGKIVASYYEEPREILLFFYYPSNEYISYLMTQEALMFVDEIDCKDLFPGEDPRERILIFEVG